MLSAKQLLNNKFTGTESPKSKRHAAHEFQAFAYKIAADFNDLENLRIYLSVLKNCERLIVEKAYSFTIDSRSENKAKVFFWKIKQLRKEFEDYKNSTNFDWDFVKKHIKKVRDVYSEDIVDGAKLRSEFIQNLILKYTPSRVLMVNVPVHVNGFKRLDYVDQSSKLLKLINVPPSHKKTTDFLSYKPKFKYDLVVSDYSWNTIPFDYEVAFLSTLVSSLNASGRTVVTIKIAPKSQSWRQKEINGKIYWIFQKFTPIEYFMDQVKKLNLLAEVLDMTDKTATIELTLQK
jgi:phospholipid N-methyltransferase